MTSTAAKPLAVLLLILALGAGSAGFILLRDSAPLFQSTAAVRVVRDQTDLEQLPASAPAGLDTAFFLQNEAELVRSDLILQQVIERLDLNHEWGNRFNDGQKLKSAETATILKARLQVTPETGDSLLRIQAASDTDAEATQLATALATAYCEYRVARRQRIAQSTIDALATAYQENEAKVRRATERVAQARQELDPAIREQNPPPQLKATEGALTEQRRALTRVTMIYLAQSNQLVLSRSLPTNELQKLKAQVARTYTELTNVSNIVQIEANKQEALRAYWLARQELEAAELMFAPYRQAVAAKRNELGPLTNAPAYIAEAATSPAKALPASKATAAKGCLIAAGVLLAAGAGVFLTSRFSDAKA